MADPERHRKHAAELVALAPDVILALPAPDHGGVATGDPHHADRVRAWFSTRSAPAFVESLARPGGNATGFMQFEYSMSGKWLELLKQIAPGVTRAAVLRRSQQRFRDRPVRRHPGHGAVAGRWKSGPINVRDAAEIERAVTAFARAGNGGLIVTAGGRRSHRELIIRLAAQHRLPAVYPYRYFVAGGGLISYGPDLIDLYRQAAGYVDRILKGEKPADLPVQAPTKYELVINLKTAKALGLDVPPTLLARADEVIE